MASAAAGPGKDHTVTIENMQFNPQGLTVHRGDRIVWVNKDLFPHTATAAGVFDSGSIASNGSWTYVAAKSGEYAYGCTFHPTMKAKITVQ
jgi:plastocyanin